MTKNITDLEAGLGALELPSKTAPKRKEDARNHFRKRVISEGAKPDIAISESLEIALKGVTKDYDKRLKAGKNAAGIAFTSRVMATASDVRSRLPKRKPKQTHSNVDEHKQHWSFADNAMIAMVFLFVGIGILIFAILAPVIFLIANETNGVGAGTAANFFAFLATVLIFGGLGGLVLNIIRTKNDYDFEAKRREREHGEPIPSPTSH